MGHPADIKGPLIIYDCLQNTEIEQNLLMKWKLVSLHWTVCVSDREKLKYQFATCFISGGLFKLAHAHEAEISQSCSGGIIAPRFLSRLLWMEEPSPPWHPLCTPVNEVNTRMWRVQPTLGSLCHAGMDVWAMVTIHDRRFLCASTDGSNWGAARQMGRKYHLLSTSGELAIKDQYNHHRRGFITGNVWMSGVNKYIA